jgi:hypothetical protein
VIAVQIEALQRMLDAVEQREGGWMRLARRPAEAEQIIGTNKLAIVLGVEVDTLFGCAAEGDVRCQSATYEPALDRLYTAGVRQIIPIHLIDNGFGGAAIYDDHMNVNQLYLRGTRLEPDPDGCQDERVDFELSNGLETLVTAKLATGVWYLPRYAHAPNGKRGHCNVRGLTRDGEALVHNLDATRHAGRRRAHVGAFDGAHHRARTERNCADLARRHHLLLR